MLVMSMSACCRWAPCLALAAAILLGSILPGYAATQQSDSFQPLLGWWTGKGRLGFSNGNTEEVKCRATYRRAQTGDGLLQALRCATASGAIEVKSRVGRRGDELTGTWSETKYNFDGQVAGKVIANGFRVFITGSGVKANMTVVVRKERHIVEIQFTESSLVGLTMIFSRS
ncbi:MAG: hypothetical protein CBC34_012180 [Hyphomicrobiaceae bacterium TMED74]|nr:MAG: hypothetical protein CBC34_012180 [Hyphomicrobiaceae bacterium TMED74]